MSQFEDRTSGRLAAHVLAIAGFLLAFAIAGAIWRFAPSGQLSVHFDLHGRPDYWMDRTHAALATAELIAVCAASYAGMGLLTGASARNLRIIRLIIVLLAIMIAVIMAAGTFGIMNSPDLGPSRLQPMILSLLIVVIGALIGKASPNPLVGVRTYWALRSRLAWDKSNRLCGRLFFWIGLGGLLASVFVEPAVVIVAVIVAIIIATGAAIVESWRVWRTDPDRQLN
jgi:uncharacterized membrane protein